MFTVTVQKLKYVTAVILAISPNTKRDYCKKINGPSNLTQTTFGAQLVFHL